MKTEKTEAELSKSSKLLESLAVCLFPFLIALTGCDHSFEPNLENDRYHFSIYGTLDASADTQWVRVMPVRDSLFLAPHPIDATVTLKHLSTGETVRMNDSLFHYGENAYVWNFWTKKELLPGEEYRLRAERSDGRESSAATTLPGDFPLPEVLYNCGGAAGNVLQAMNVLIEGVERLVVVEMTYIYRIGEDPVERIHRVYRHLQTKTELLDGRTRIFVTFEEDLVELAFLMGVSRGGLVVQEAGIFIASAGPNWPDTEVMDFEEMALPDAICNVENGVGVLAGIVGKTVPVSPGSCER